MEKFNFSFLLVLAISILTVLDTVNGVKFKCSNTDEYFFAKPNTHCGKYYRCTAKAQKEVHECGPGSMFDFYSQTCTRNSGICYEPICTGRANGVYQDTTHACRRSFTCRSGKIISVDNCPPFHLHDGTKCANQELVSCENPHSTAIGYSFSGDRRCLGKTDGNYGVEDCSSFVICRSQQVTDLQKCPKGQRFKSSRNACVPANQVTFCSGGTGTDMTEHACRHKRDGPHWDPSSPDCKSFLVCRNGALMAKETCLSDSVFNGELCVPAPLYTCPSTMWDSSNDICRKRNNGFHSNPIQGCSSYVRCMSGRTVEIYECPNGHYFDPEEKTCISKKFTNSHQKKCTEPQKSPDCNNKAQGFYQSSSCHNYYFCFNGFKTEFKCSVGKVFDGENCVSQNSYSCPHDQSLACMNKPDGYYADRQGGCRSYYFCSNGNKITYLCEIGHIFDGSKCVPATGRMANKCSSRDNACKGKSDGYHADVNTNCRNYMYCKNGEKITQLTCRGSSIFNGEKCVPSNMYACPSQYNHRQLNCMPKKCAKGCLTDGFHADIESGCRNYFFCIGGKRSSLSCTAGQIFNGEVCVPQDQYTCPTFCNDSYSNSQECPQQHKY